MSAPSARAASRILATTATEARDRALLRAADLLRTQTEPVLCANAEDLAASTDVPSALRSRLALDAAKVETLARGLESVAALPDPLGHVDLRRLLDEGLELSRTTVPLGVLLVIFESRPDVAVQIGALAIKSGNAALLKGGREARRSVAALLELMRQALSETDLPPDALQALASREDVDTLLDATADIDLVIPRGSSELVRSLQARTRIPVLGHAEGICHLYLDAAADPAMALRLVRDAKLQYPAACNAVETVLIHAGVASALVPALAADLGPQGVQLRGCPACRTLAPMAAATEADWDTEYGEPILALKVVADLDAALAHIARHGSGHTEAIVTEDSGAARRFLIEVDAAGVYHNASTRFADGYRYGFGAEVGISTGRLHARGPVGLEGLVTWKYLLRGSGQSVAPYAEGRPFLHRNLPLG